MPRPQGSKNLPSIKKYIGKKDIEAITEKAIKKAKDGDVIMQKFLMEQYFGKAQQNITAEGELNLIVKYDEAFEIASRTTKDNIKSSEI